MVFPKGQTPLHLATSSEVTKLLIHSHADIFVADKDNNTPLTKALSDTCESHEGGVGHRLKWADCGRRVTLGLASTCSAPQTMRGRAGELSRLNPLREPVATADHRPLARHPPNPQSRRIRVTPTSTRCSKHCCRTRGPPTFPRMSARASIMGGGRGWLVVMVVVAAAVVVVVMVVVVVVVARGGDEGA